MIHKDLLDILVCPKCKQPITAEEAQPDEGVQSWLTCHACRLRYPVRDDIPIMLIEEASPVRARA